MGPDLGETPEAFSFSMRQHPNILFVSLFLAAATVAVYGRACLNDFVNFDDDHYVTDNAWVQHGFTAQTVPWAFRSRLGGNWHPLTWLSLQLDYRIYGGLKAWGFHLTNVLLHTAASVALFLCLTRLTATVWRSAMVAALFALHPEHVESVAWVAERKDVLGALFWFLTLWAYAAYAERPSAARYLLVVLAFGLGLMSKPMLVTLPFVLLLLDYWPLGRLRLGSHADEDSVGQRPAPRWLVVLEKLPLLVLSVGCCIITLHAQKEGDALKSLMEYTLPVRVGNAIVSYVAYLGMTVFPVGLSVLYPHPKEGLSAFNVTVAALLLLGITWTVARWSPRSPYLAVGWLWYLGTLVPVIGLVQVGRQALADRYMYIPSLGLFLMAVWGIGDYLERSNRRTLAAPLAAVILLACAAQTWLHLGHWKDSGTLWNHALAVNDRNPVAHYNLGVFLETQRKTGEALKHYLTAAEIDPDYGRARHNAGVLLERAQHYEEAAKHYRETVRLDPSAQAYSDLGVVVAKMNRLEEARSWLAQALEINPNLVRAHVNLGDVLYRLKKPDDAVRHYAEALQREPANVAAHCNLAVVLVAQGQVDDAIQHYYSAIEAAPGLREAHLFLAKLLVANGKPGGAVSHYLILLRREPESAGLHYALGRALALQGKNQEALSCFQDAVRFQSNQARFHCAEGYQLNKLAQPEAARAAYQRASQLEPGWPRAATKESWRLATDASAGARDGSLALELAEQVCQAVGTPDAHALDARAAALAELRRFPEAVDWARKAETLARSAGSVDLAGAIKERLKLYERRQPFRDVAQ